MVDPIEPIGSSPIDPQPPVEVRDGWRVSGRQTDAPLVLRDESHRPKVLVRAAEGGTTATELGVRFGQAQRVEGGLLVGAGPGEWLFIGHPGPADSVLTWMRDRMDGAELTSVVDYTHGRALMRLTGLRAADTLAHLCAINLSDAATPDLAALRTSVASVVTDVVRDDQDGLPSYLLHVERSSGRYLFGVLLDAGAPSGIDVGGFPSPVSS